MTQAPLALENRTVRGIHKGGQARQKVSPKSKTQTLLVTSNLHNDPSPRKEKEWKKKKDKIFPDYNCLFGNIIVPESGERTQTLISSKA